MNPQRLPGSSVAAHLVVAGLWMIGAGAMPLRGLQVEGGGEHAGAAGIVVERYTPSRGPELWVSPSTGDGSTTLALVFPRASGSGAAVVQLASTLARDCPPASPAALPGPDYDILAVSVPSGRVESTMLCLGGVLTPPAAPGRLRDSDGATSVEASGTASGEDGGDPGTRSAAGVLLSALYHPAPVPGGALAEDEAPEESVGSRPSHLIVVGDVAGRRLAGWASEAFPGSTGEAASGDAVVAPRPPVATEVLVLDRPGGGLTEVVVGQLTLPGNHPDWMALVVARELLASRLRGRGWSYVELLRVRGPGAFVAGGRLAIDRIPEAVGVLAEEVEALRTRLPSEAEVRQVAERLGGEFSQAVRTGEGLAGQLARAAALGLDPNAVTRYPERLADLTPDAVRRAVRSHLDPARFLVALAGDASAAEAVLDVLGPVRRVEGAAPPEDWPSLRVDGSRLEAGSSTYRVLVGGREVGRARREISPTPQGRLRFASTARVGEGAVRQEIIAGLPGLAFLEGTSTAGGEGAVGRLEHRHGRLTGTLPGGRRVDLALPEGAVVADLLEPSLWAAELEAGAAYRVAVLAPDGGGVRWASVRVSESQPVTVPAGTFPVLRVDVSGPEVLTLWLRRAAPHLTVRLASANGVVLELVESADGGGR